MNLYPTIHIVYVMAQYLRQAPCSAYGLLRCLLELRRCLTHERAEVRHRDRVRIERVKGENNDTAIQMQEPPITHQAAGRGHRLHGDLALPELGTEVCGLRNVRERILRFFGRIEHQRHFAHGNGMQFVLDLGGAGKRAVRGIKRRSRHYTANGVHRAMLFAGPNVGMGAQCFLNTSHAQEQMVGADHEFASIHCISHVSIVCLKARSTRQARTFMTQHCPQLRRFTGFLLFLVLTGCGSTVSTSLAHPTVIAVPTNVSQVESEVIVADTRRLATQQYSVDHHVVGLLSNGIPFYVFHSVCTGSADGHCQAVDVFLGRERTARWHRQFAGVSALMATAGGFSLRLTDYLPTDPLCCPSGATRIYTYRWNGTAFAEAPPGH